MTTITAHSRAMATYMAILILSALAASIMAAHGGHPLPEHGCTTDSECEALYGQE